MAKKNHRRKKQTAQHFQVAKLERQHHGSKKAQRRQHNPKRRASQRRHGNLRSNMGRMMEERVAEIGARLVEEGKLTDFMHHEPNSAEDAAGKDFTAVQADGITRSFGITISGHGGAQQASMRHPDVPQWFFEWNIGDETVRNKILGLFRVEDELPENIPDEKMRQFLVGPHEEN